MNADHFWSFVPIRPEAPDACWEWCGAMSGRGQRTPYYWPEHRGRSTTATRVAWELSHGPVRDRRKVRRKCCNARCVRPDHLRLGPKPREIAEGKGHFGESNPNAILSDAEVRNIRVLYSRGGASQARLAAYFKTTQATVSHIVRGETRRAAGGPIHGEAVAA